MSGGVLRAGVAKPLVLYSCDHADRHDHACWHSSLAMLDSCRHFFALTVRRQRIALVDVCMPCAQADCRTVRLYCIGHGCACRVLQAAAEVLHKALQTLHMKAEVSCGWVMVVEVVWVSGGRGIKVRVIMEFLWGLGHSTG